MRKRVEKLRFLTVALALLTSLLCLTLNVSATDTQDQPTVIKVGYMLNYGTIKSPIIKGSEGYGYEYLTEIFKYAKGDYQLEFVYCEWEEGKAMLESGDLDILGPTTYTEAGSQLYGYPENSFGDNMIFLSAFSEESAQYANYSYIDGKKIAVQTNNPNEYLLYEFLEENGIEAEVVYFTDNNYESALENLDCDLCLASSLQTFTNLTPVATLGVLDFYYVTDYGDDALLEEINYAMEQLGKSEFLYQEQTYLSYYNYTISDANYISDEDIELIQSKDPYTVGIENFYSSVVYENDNGELVGIAIDVLEMLSQTAGFSYEIVEVTADTPEAVLATLDFAFLTLNETAEVELLDSNPYCEVPFLMVDRMMSDGEDIENIGVLPYYGITEVESENYIYDREMHMYSNILEMQEAYNQGEIDSFIVTSATLNVIRNGFDDLYFISRTLDVALNLCISFPATTDSELIAVFNKFISQLSVTEVDKSILLHSATATAIPPTMTDVMGDYIVEIGAFLLFVVLTIIATIWHQRRKLAHILNHDDLTGFYTQHKFIVEAEKLIAKSPNGTYSVLSLDIDNFKYINEFYGYEVGSKVLRTVAQSIKMVTESDAVIARSSADNFLILVPKKGLFSKIEYAEQNSQFIYVALEKYLGEMYNITFSVGIYEVNDKKIDLSFMIDCANLARYLGKGTAKTTVHKFSAEMDSLRISNNDIVANMAKALEEEEFVLLYQPKIDLSIGNLVGAEALVRWVRNGQFVPPDKFIPLFERNGFIERLDYYVLGKACAFMAANPNAPKISINLSGMTVMQENLDERVFGVIDKYKIPYERIDLEITETAFVEKFEQCVDRIQGLREKGISISMDDFGAGISSLNRLKNIPIDILKIDREFIVDSIGNPRGSHIIKSVVQMAKDLNLETVAEGIETKEQEEFLKNLGCDVGQGYYFARPLSEKDFLRFMDR